MRSRRANGGRAKSWGADRSSVRYVSRRPDEAVTRAHLRELAAVRRRFGYRRQHIHMSREGVVMNHKKFRRLYREERLQVRRRGGRKRAIGTRTPMAIQQGHDQRWSLDFACGAFTDGRRFRILAIVDDFTRECLVLVADTSLPGQRVVRELDAVAARRGVETKLVIERYGAAAGDRAPDPALAKAVARANSLSAGVIVPGQAKLLLWVRNC